MPARRPSHLSYNREHILLVSDTEFGGFTWLYHIYCKNSIATNDLMFRIKTGSSFSFSISTSLDAFRNVSQEQRGNTKRLHDICLKIILPACNYECMGY